MGWLCKTCELPILTGSVPCPKCGQFRNRLAKKEYEINQFIDLLEKFDQKAALSTCAFSFLCNFHKNEFVKLGKPDNIKVNDKEEIGPSNLEHFIEIKSWGLKYLMSMTVEDVKKDVEERIRKAILREQ